jgi:hypothetical protein
LENKDSRTGESPEETGQAGMTVSEYYGAIYEYIKFDNSGLIFFFAHFAALRETDVSNL